MTSLNRICTISTLKLQKREKMKILDIHMIEQLLELNFQITFNIELEMKYILDT
jgi:hypothetical protein